MRKVFLSVAFLVGFLVGPSISPQGSPSYQNLIPPPEPIRGLVALPSGEQIHYEYHFDHNALSDAVEVAGSIFAITDSGNLLRFDAKTLQMTGQEIVSGQATAIATEGSRVLLGTADGQVLAVDPAIMAQTRVARFGGRVLWLTGDRTEGAVSRIVAAIAPTTAYVVWPGESDKHLEARTKSNETRAWRIWILGARPRSFTLRLGKKASVRAYPSAFSLDDHDRLWMGVNGGEFGGNVSYLDLQTGRVDEVAKGWDVIGFLNTHGDVPLVYGGVSHLGGNYGFIAKPDGARLNVLHDFEREDGTSADKDKDRSPDNMPQGPVDRVLRDDSTDGFWVLSGQSLYRTDLDFKTWTKTVYIDGRWIAGRSLSALANTPTVNSLLIEPSLPGEMIAIMGRDGLARISGDHVQQFRFDGQLEPSIVDVWTTSLGTVFLPDFHANAGLWRLEANQWSAEPLVPHRPPMDADQSWEFSVPIADDGTGIVAFCGDSISPGERDLIRVKSARQFDVLSAWRDGSSQWQNGFVPASAGTFLEFDSYDLDDPGGFFGKLRLRDGAEYHDVGTDDIGFAAGDFWADSGRPFVPLGTSGGVEYLLDGMYGQIHELLHKPDGSYLFVQARYAKGRTPHNIFDASPDKSGRDLVASPEGLLNFRLQDGNSSRILGPEPNGRILSLCRDAQGRLWAAGDGLYVSSDEGNHWQLVDLPMMIRNTTKRIRPDPQNPRGLILALADRGVVFLSW